MAVTGPAEVTNQIQTFWAPMFMQEFRSQLLLAALVNKEYDGQITSAGGQTVRVSQITKATGENKTVGVDADSFSPETLTTQYVDVTADKRAVASFEFNDLVQLQSQIGSQDSEIRAALLQGVGEQVNNYLYSLVVPSASSPDHLVASVSDMNSAALSATRILAGQAKWLRNKPWYGLLDPSYYGDAMDDTTLSSSDYTDDKPIVGGQMAQPRFGFNLLEDNSDGLINNLPTGTVGAADKAIFFHPDFLHLVTQQMPRFKVSDQHANHRFAYTISVDMVYGAKMGIDGANKVVQVYNS
jgi:hypothetical protein